MELTKNDIAFLRSINVGEQDFDQIAEAADCTEYELLDVNADKTIRRLTKDAAIKKLGHNNWLDGLARSAFHFSCVRETKDCKNYVYFNSRKLFN